MGSYTDELLDGFDESLDQFGTSIALVGNGMVVQVVAVGPETSLVTENAGFQEKGTFTFEVRRVDARAAGLNETSRFTLPGSPARYQVQPIEDDPGLPLLYVSAHQVQ